MQCCQPVAKGNDRSTSNDLSISPTASVSISRASMGVGALKSRSESHQDRIRAKSHLRTSFPAASTAPPLLHGTGRPTSFTEGPAKGFLGPFELTFPAPGSGIVLISDLRNRKPPAVPDRHDAEREARNQRCRSHRSYWQLQHVSNHHDGSGRQRSDGI